VLQFLLLRIKDVASLLLFQVNELERKLREQEQNSESVFLHQKVRFFFFPFAYKIGTLLLRYIHWLISQ
jgi:hypothetical protein